LLRPTIRRHAFFSPATAERLDRGLDGATAWDILRTSETDPTFAIPTTREMWESRCARDFLVERGAAIASLANRVGARAIVGYGVGSGCVEYQIHKSSPDLALYLSDFAPETVARLRRVFPDSATVSVVDLLRDDLSAIPGAMTLLHRVDAQFTDDELRQIFGRLRAGGHHLILVVPDLYLTARELVVEIGRRMATRAGLRHATPCGRLRTRSAYDSYWRGLYETRSRGPMGGGLEYILLGVPGSSDNWALERL
jgi:hypothetical protein